jgi:hypothetical protein
VKSPNEFQVFCKFLYWHGINGQTRPLCSTFDLFQDMRFLRESGARKSRKYGIRKSRESGDRGPAKPWNHGPANLRVQISEIRGSWMEDSGISRKPSQRRYLKSPGLACELVTSL